MGRVADLFALTATLSSILLTWCDRGLALDRSLDVSQYVHDSWRVQEGFTWARTNAIAQTPDGYLWVGTDDARNVAAGPGLYRFNGDKNIRWDPPPGQQLPSNLISWLLAARDGTLWIGTANGLASLKDGKLTHFEGLVGFYIFTMLEDRGGTVWVGGIRNPTGRLCAIRASSIDCYGEDGSFGTGVVGLYEDQQGNLWVGSKNGFWRWKPSPSEFFPMPGALDSIRAFFEDGDGGLLFTTRSGIERLMKGKIEPFSLPGNLQPPRVMCMLRDRDGGLWLGTWNSGILHVHQGRTDVYRDGLTGGDVAALLEDREGDIWAVTSEGLDRFRDPAFKTRPPPVLIEQIAADGKDYNAFNGLRLPAHVRDLEIDYTALTLIAPDNSHFRYKLEGQDPNWREVVNDRKVQYSNLPPGDYHFRVTACNSSGVWNEAGASLDFSIAPAYYQTLWFRLSCVVAFLALLAGLHGLRLRQLAQQFNRIMEARVGERTRIARDLHDSLLQSVQGLMFRLQAVRDMLPGPSEAIQALDVALERGDKAIAEGRDTVADLRQSVVGDSDIAKVLTALGAELAAQADNGATPCVRVLVGGKQRELNPMLRDEIYRIAREALRNASRHAKAQKIEAGITYGDSEFLLHVRDDGSGIDPAVADQGARAGHWGLPGMRERAKSFGGKLEVWSERGAGTEIKLSVPATIAYGKSDARSRFWFLRRKTEQTDGRQP